jgi:membrane-bound lytic murein transglycosylase B
MIFTKPSTVICQFAFGYLLTLLKLDQRQFRRIALASIVAVLPTLWLAPTAVAQQMLAGRPDVEAFLDDLASRYWLDRKILAAQFAGLTTDPNVIRLMQPVSPGKRSWENYRANHLDRVRIREGGRFLAKHRLSLKAAERAFGVPAEIITAILVCRPGNLCTKSLQLLQD